MSNSDLPGAPIWIELYTEDTQAAAAFYGELFGWTTVDSGPEYGGYVTFQRDGEPVAGLMRNDGTTGGVNSWSVYLESDDVTNTVGMAEANGGEIEIEPMQVGALGHMAFVTDPSGARVGIWQPLEHQGFAARAEVGAPAWFELLTSDYESVIPFYRNVFGWDTHTMSDTDEFRYTTLGKDEEARAGIMDAKNLLDGQRSRWSFYVQVEDTDVAVKRALAAGANELMRVDDSPYGRLAAIADPVGVPFMLMGPNLAPQDD
ncbi:VOC family protein [Nocardioides sp.]|jgi:predicted enzyme related to lactoylglutathione lyase|uniref:VOC family protein n=1 Tax=Nocardioides sp. TaxID=35761 RepID=UPI0031FEC1A7|nr:Glyoxalase/bleomycin resistance protein/dioxygenase [Nocardioides sp.]